MLHPSTELRFVNEQIGYGIFATERIPAGTITWAICELDQRLAPERVAALPALARTYLDKYAYADAEGRHVLCCDNARFINHACEASCLPGGLDFEVAVRDIERGEQLTDDYGGLNLTESFECGCGSPVCRRVIHPADALRYAAVWDAQVEPLLPLLPKLDQPLWHLVQHKPDIADILAGRPIPSTLRHYFSQGGAQKPKRVSAGRARGAR